MTADICYSLHHYTLLTLCCCIWVSMENCQQGWQSDQHMQAQQRQEHGQQMFTDSIETFSSCQWVHHSLAVHNFMLLTLHLGTCERYIDA